MAKKEILFPGYSSKLNSTARKEKRWQNQEYKKIEKDKNKGIMEFPVLKTLPKTYYRIPNPGNGKIIKRGDQFLERIKPINAEEIKLPWYLLACYEAKLLFLKKVK